MTNQGSENNSRFKFPKRLEVLKLSDFHEDMEGQSAVVWVNPDQATQREFFAIAADQQMAVNQTLEIGQVTKARQYIEAVVEAGGISFAIQDLVKTKKEEAETKGEIFTRHDRKRLKARMQKRLGQCQDLLDKYELPHDGDQLPFDLDKTDQLAGQANDRLFRWMSTILSQGKNKDDHVTETQIRFLATDTLEVHPGFWPWLMNTVQDMIRDFRAGQKKD